MSWSISLQCVSMEILPHVYMAALSFTPPLTDLFFPLAFFKTFVRNLKFKAHMFVVWRCCSPTRVIDINSKGCSVALRVTDQSAITSAGKDRNSEVSCRGEIISSSKAVEELITSLSTVGAETPSLQLPCLHTGISARDELHSALQSLSSSLSQQGEGERSSAESDKSTENESLSKERAVTHSSVRNQVVSKIVFSLAPGMPCSGSPHWV